jgi:hypothetical protein
LGDDLKRFDEGRRKVDPEIFGKLKFAGLGALPTKNLS